MNGTVILQQRGGCDATQWWKLPLPSPVQIHDSQSAWQPNINLDDRAIIAPLHGEWATGHVCRQHQAIWCHHLGNRSSQDLIDGESHGHTSIIEPACI